jgi:hypothetical protein
MLIASHFEEWLPHENPEIALLSDSWQKPKRNGIFAACVKYFAQVYD